MSNVKISVELKAGAAIYFQTSSGMVEGPIVVTLNIPVGGHEEQSIKVRNYSDGRIKPSDVEIRIVEVSGTITVS